MKRPSHRKRQHGFAVVYYVQRMSDRAVKIGTSTDVAKRVRQLQARHGPGVVLLATEEGGYRQEAERHRQWAALRLEGEWFRGEEELMEFIGRLRLQGR